MTVTDWYGRSRFSEIWVTKTGLSTDKPLSQDCVPQSNAESMAEVILELFGLGGAR